MHDVVVVGGGPGGYAAAIRSSQLGGKVALVEAAEMGGTCVNRGCIPSKIWHRTAYLLHWIRKADMFGIKASMKELDLQAIVSRNDGVSNDIRMGMESLLGNNGVAVIQGRAVLKGPREVDVEGAVVEGKKIILATGSRPFVPNMAGLQEAALTTNQVLEMTELPRSVLVWGESGAIGVEMASLLTALGSKVILVTRSRRILPREDGDTGQRLAQALRQQGVEIITRCGLHSIQESENGLVCFLSGEQERKVEVERLLVTTRRPNTDRLGLEQIGIRLHEDGAIRVNERLESSLPGVYAVGDATGGWMLSHAASSMGIVAAENAMGRDRKYASHLVPRGIWTIPQVAAVGISEEEAEARGLDVVVGDFPYSIGGLPLCRDETQGAVKVISEARYGEILGVHIVGADATELIGEAVLAMQLEARINELAYSIRVHPTFSEGLVDAARDSAKWALYLPKRQDAD